jgi:predicted PurR-regulated permease PerM
MQGEMQTIERRHHERELAIRFTRAAISIGVLALLAAIFSPFFSVIAWSAVICYALYPLHRRLVRAVGGHRTFSALIMCLIITVGVILPVTALSILIGEEVTRTYVTVSMLRAQEGSFLHDGWRDVPLVSTALDRLHAYERLTGKDLRSVFAENLNDIGKFAVSKLMHLATNLLRGVIELGFILIVSFFFFRDGDALVSWLRELLPFSDERQTLILHRFDEVVTGSIYGNALVSVIVGVVGGLAFFAAGLHSPVLWGTVMGILAYLPIAGAPLVWIPGAIYLFFKSAYIQLGIICLAGAVIFFLDHVIRNVLVANRVRLHPLLVLFSVFGGIHLFGLLGLVAGPLIVAVARVFLDIYRLERSREKSAEPTA